MKKLLFTWAVAAWGLLAHAQQCDIPMQVIVPDPDEGMSLQNADYLKNVLRRVLVSGDDVAQFTDSRFGIVVEADIMDKHIVAGAPQKTVLNLLLTLYVGDVQEGTLFASHTIEVNGVGNNDTKAYNSALRRLNAQNRQLNEFVAQGKRKVIEWYDRNYPLIIKRAQTAAGMHQYEEALHALLSVPECCKGYDAALAQVRKVYQQYVDRRCEENLTRAQVAWMTGFNSRNAATAASFLGEIYPDAACHGEAMKLVREIKQHMGEEWKFEMKQWSDVVSVESQRLTHAREIAMAYAQNQPQVVHRHFR